MKGRFKSATGPRALVVWIGVAAITLIALLGFCNYLMNPLTFRVGALRKVAEVLNRGQNFALDDPNIDFRGIRREHIRLMSSAPDVLLFAGSRFEVATANTFPGRTFYNAFVHNDYFEDLLAVTALLEEADKLPKTLVLSARHLSFRPISDRETDEWRMFSPEYKRMAQHLEIPVAPALERFPVSHYQSMFSMEYLKHGIIMAMQKTALPYGATSQVDDPERDILHADGSLAFSKKHIGTFTPESARAEAAAQAKKLGKKKASLPTSDDVKSLEKLLRYLHAKGVQSVIAITPHHPAFWEGVANENYGRTLSELEARIKSIAINSNAVFVGSFDPQMAGCRESSFRDYIHLDEVCLKSIFAQIPPLVAAKD
ncbi:hypothetical protein [Phyllobacterium leguminum]|uniref:Uncharacterized protein n=1 Tax=Phyllobacterium leguminum TaxID=314237 RepID=A0A318SXT9_9HYPH|nr:hypothetical protein [Phyllobacterium leguminum]PYE85136.1 hypothetical protein C7477_1416 [Phyllobacterium leguminum]